ncbi:MAG: GntR family transcriptional regulator [Ruminococcaceae bacterium]|nr:GntR family transcriptional regulator [Oscillospiraceae bacterium]
MAWNFSEHIPVYIQIAERLRRSIIKGEYSCGEQVPPVRRLAVTAAVNPNTVQKAFSLLESEKLIAVRGTFGYFVTSDTELIDKAKKAAASSLVKELLSKAEDLNIGKDELIFMIKGAELNGNT